MGLDQHVEFSTHVAGNSLDLVLTEALIGISILKCEPGQFISDHCAVNVVINVKKESIIIKTVSFRNFKNIDKLELANDLRGISVECDDVNAFVNMFESEINSILDQRAPLTQKTKICRAPKPWFNES